MSRTGPAIANPQQMTGARTRMDPNPIAVSKRPIRISLTPFPPATFPSPLRVRISMCDVQNDFHGPATESARPWDSHELPSRWDPRRERRSPDCSTFESGTRVVADLLARPRAHAQDPDPAMKIRTHRRGDDGGGGGSFSFFSRFTLTTTRKAVYDMAIAIAPPIPARSIRSKVAGPGRATCAVTETWAVCWFP